MESIARSIMLVGIVVFLIGAAAFLTSRLNLPLGRLPGDIRIEGENGTFYFSLASSILVSVIVSLLLNFFFHRTKRMIAE